MDLDAQVQQSAYSFSPQNRHLRVLAYLGRGSMKKIGARKRMNSEMRSPGLLKDATNCILQRLQRILTGFLYIYRVNVYVRGRVPAYYGARGPKAMRKGQPFYRHIINAETDRGNSTVFFKVPNNFKTSDRAITTHRSLLVPSTSTSAVTDVPERANYGDPLRSAWWNSGRGHTVLRTEDAAELGSDHPRRLQTRG